MFDDYHKVIVGRELSGRWTTFKKIVDDYNDNPKFNVIKFDAMALNVQDKLKSIHDTNKINVICIEHYTQCKDIEKIILDYCDCHNAIFIISDVVNRDVTFGDDFIVITTLSNNDDSGLRLRVESSSALKIEEFYINQNLII